MQQQGGDPLAFLVQLAHVVGDPFLDLGEAQVGLVAPGAESARAWVVDAGDPHVGERLDRLAVEVGPPERGKVPVHEGAVVVVARDGDLRVVPLEGGVQGVEAELLPGLAGRRVVAGIQHDRGTGLVGDRAHHLVHADVVVPVADQHRHRLVGGGLVQLVGDLADAVLDPAVEDLAAVVGVEQAQQQAPGALGDQAPLDLPALEVVGDIDVGQGLLHRQPRARLDAVRLRAPRLHHQQCGDHAADHRHRQHTRAGAFARTTQLGATTRADHYPQPDRHQSHDRRLQGGIASQPGHGTRHAGLLGLGPCRDGGVPLGELGRGARRRLAHLDVDPDAPVRGRPEVGQVGTHLEAHPAVEGRAHHGVVAREHQLGAGVGEDQSPGRQSHEGPGEHVAQHPDHSPAGPRGARAGRAARVDRARRLHYVAAPARCWATA